MKAIILITLFVTSSFFGFSQVTTQNLDHNNANATLSNSGSVFNDAQNGLPGYELPKGGGVHSAFLGQFWFAGKDINGQLHASLGGVENLGTDIDQGPFSSNGMYNHPSYDAPFMVTLCQEEIDQFNLWWECTNGVTTVGCDAVQQPSAAVLSSIFDWPAHGDLSLGQNFYLAPFYDRDGDGNYDPAGSGDYPLIKGCCATYIIQNDAGNIHTFSGYDPIGIEMHYLFYQFGANNDLYNTTFVDVLAINKGSINYPEFIHGFLVHGSSGISQDDYFGSDSLTSSMIFYNADNMDELGYLSNPPAIGVVALNTPSTSIVNAGPLAFNTSTAWNVMNGLQPNGLPIQDPNGNTTKFLFSGDPNDPTAWNETSVGSFANERKGISATNIGAFNSGDSILQTYAIVHSEGGNHLENASNVINLASWAKTFYDTDINNGCEAGGVASQEEIFSEVISIYPNPSQGVFTIASPESQLKSVDIIDVAGKQVHFSVQKQGVSWRVNLTENAVGMYLIQVETEHGTITRRLIVE